MLHLHYSNRTEALFTGLSEVVATPIQDIFQPEVIVVEEAGMARWLAQELATRQGITANIKFPQPAGFVWQLLHGQLGKGTAEAGFSKSSLLWYSMTHLPMLKQRPGFEAIQRYLSGSEEEIKTYQLSRQVADLFDQYLVYRPELIMAWEEGKGSSPATEDEVWQAQLWREMRKGSSESHWAGLLQEFKRSITAEGFKGNALPERVSLFAISSLSPGYIELLALIADYIDIHLFVLNPSINYWGDIVSEQALTRLRSQWRRTGREDISEIYMVGNPLLASMGKPCRDFIDQWHDHPAQEHEYFSEPGEGSLLEWIQGDILNLQARGSEGIAVKAIELDHSIQIHACHSPMREVQVLHDQLLSLFDKQPDLSPHEIVVMAPDINKYAPYIEAVFGSVPDRRRIPYSLAGEAVAENPLIETLLSWILLPDERFEAPTVLGWLEIPSIQRRLGLDDVAVERIRQWVSESGIRWGLDGEHKQELGLPDNEENSWAFGFQRLFVGYAMPTSVELYQQMAPYSDIEGGESVWLGQLQAFIDRLAQWRKVMATAATVGEWQQRLNRLIDQFFQPSEQEEILINGIREQLASMVASAELANFSTTISAQLMHQHLSSMLSSGGTTYRLLSGKVSFSNMVPVRSIPFRAVALLGMNDGDFPRNQRPLGFDLIAKSPRKGDRSLREDDRYLFLESLLSARETLHISYVGRSQQDNSEKLPSVVVTELLDYIEQGYQLDEGGIRDKLVVEHPLQPFSPRSYQLGSYAAEWLERSESADAFAAQPLGGESEGRDAITLDTLSRFIANPSKHFLHRCLGIHSAEYEEALEGSECFELDALAAYQIKTEVLSGLLAGEEIQQRFALIQARGELPHGSLSQKGFEVATEGLESLSDTVKEYLGRKESASDIELVIGGHSISGWLPNIVDGGVLRYRPAKLKAKDQLTLWVEHLAQCASGREGRSVHVAIDGEFMLAPVAKQTAAGHLETLLELYKEGADTPLPLFPTSSLEYAKKILAEKPESVALSAARGKWEGSMFYPGEHSDEWFEQAFRGVEPLNERFQDIAERVLTPMLKSAE